MSGAANAGGAKGGAEGAAGSPAAAPGAGKPAGVPDDPFRLLVASVKDYAIFMLDPTGRVRTWNLGAELIKGYRESEIVGRSIEVFYTPEDRERRLPATLLARAVADGRVEVEGWRVRKDGTRFWADVVITVLRDPAGQVTGFAKVTRDLSERRAAEEQRSRRDNELLRSEERLRLLIDAVEDYAIFMLGRDGRIATWNSGAQRLKGYEAKEIIGKHFSLFRTEEDVRAGKCEQELEVAARVGRHEEESWRVRKDGVRFWANVVLTAVRNAEGELLGFAKVTRDLTDRRRLEEERVARVRAEESVRLKDEFLSVASHELRTPLTALQIELQSLKERVHGQEEKVVKKVARAGRHADRLAALIDSLLDVTRIATGGLTLNPQRCDLVEVVTDLVDELRPAAANARCELTLTANAATLEGSWDRLRIEQAVTNLLSNAFKYGASSPVDVSVTSDSEAAIIEVRDRGSGIPEAEMSRIFGRFERAAPIRHYGGLGLGLYVAREIVAAHGGTIAARNLEGGGAGFAIRLPLVARVSAPNAESAEAR